MIDVLRAQLLALQSQITAMLAVIEAVSETDSGSRSDTPPCPHLDTENVGTFGAPEYKCTMCKATVHME